jgi:hypothetical protein
MSREKRVEIRSLVQKVADLLGCPEIAIDDRHGPKLYSRFLKGLLATPMANVDFSPNGMMNTASLPQRRLARAQKAGLERSFDELGLAIKSIAASPSMSNPASPPPPLPPTDTPFEAFPSVNGANPLLTTQDQYASGSTLLGQSDTVQALNDIDWLPTPLPFDNELLQSMQSVQNSVWGHDLSLPGQ